MKNLFKKLFSLFTKKLKRKRILKELKDFFNSENSTELHKVFLENFDFPTTMTGSPVRFDDDMQLVYYVLNFKSKEVFENKPSIEYAYSKSLQLLEENLPVGLSEYIEPISPEIIPDTYSYLCTFKIIKTKDL